MCASIRSKVLSYSVAPPAANSPLNVTCLRWSIIGLISWASPMLMSEVSLRFLSQLWKSDHSGTGLHRVLRRQPCAHLGPGMGLPLWPPSLSALVSDVCLHSYPLIHSCFSEPLYHLVFPIDTECALPSHEIQVSCSVESSAPTYFPVCGPPLSG